MEECVKNKNKKHASLIAGGADAEMVSLSNNPQFLALIERSRARQKIERGYSTQQVRDILSLKKKVKK